MSENKKTVKKYLDSFNNLDHLQILSCLTEDVEWIIPGFAHRKGKSDFDKEIENDAFEGKPEIAELRMTEENNIVIVEGTVVAKRKEGIVMKLVFCDVFEMKDTKIKKLTSYLAEIK